MLLFQIKWENRLINDDGSPCKVSVDGTDFRTVEWKPFNSARKSHKFNGPGLRCELATAIKIGFVVSLNEPFLCGSHPDLRISCQWLHNVLKQCVCPRADWNPRGTCIQTGSSSGSLACMNACVKSVLVVIQFFTSEIDRKDLTVGHAALQLFPWMGPDPVPELHRGVELIIRSVARMAGRQHLKKHSHNTVFT